MSQHPGLEVKRVFFITGLGLPERREDVPEDIGSLGWV
jgi:hypothetical protein